MNEMTCIICPNSCRLKVIKVANEIIVEGAKCKKGKDFALQELLNPKRTLTTTIKTVFPDFPVISVKTSKEVDKNMINTLMKEINDYTIDRRYELGEPIIQNIHNSGVNIIATTSMKQEVYYEAI